MSSKSSNASVTSASGSRRMVFATKKLELEKREKLMELQHQFDEDLDEISGLIEEEQRRPSRKKNGEAVAKLERERERLKRKFDRNLKQVEEKFALLMEKAKLQNEDKPVGRRTALGRNLQDKLVDANAVGSACQLSGAALNKAVDRSIVKSSKLDDYEEKESEKLMLSSESETALGNDVITSREEKSAAPVDQKWIPTGENVVDEGNQLRVNADLSCESSWIRGPDFRRLDSEQYPRKSDDETGVIEVAAGGDTEEVGHGAVGTTMSNSPHGKAKRTADWKSPPCKWNREEWVSPLKTEHLMAAEKQLIRAAQEESAVENTLRKNKEVKAFRDEDGRLRVEKDGPRGHTSKSFSEYLGDHDREKYGRMWEKAQLMAKKVLGSVE